MKELEKTKRISVATVLTILVIIIALLSYKRPKHLYTVNTKETLEKIMSRDYFISLNDLSNSNDLLIDIRNQYEYNKGYLENAINMYAPEILNNENSKLLKKNNEEGKSIVLYGGQPNEALTPYMLLSQMGFDNLKILLVNITYDQNKLITENTSIEKSVPDINAYIQESREKAAENSNSESPPKSKIVNNPKRIITVKKKKKMPVEGGC